ncbi:hypothetical protein D3C85_1238170 [compost metagenome]
MIDTLENPVLDRVGVLEFVDQGHRKLFPDQARQTLAASTLQGRIEPQQHVVEAHFRAAALLFFKTCTDPARRVLEHSGVRGWQGLQAVAQGQHGLQGRMVRWRALPGFGHAVGGQASKTGADVQLLLCFIFGPGAQLVEPGFEIARLHLAPIDGLAGQALHADFPQLPGPLGPGCLERAQGFGALHKARANQLSRFADVGAGLVLAEHGAHSRQQRRRAAPVLAHPRQRLALHAVTEAPPVIA